MKDNAKISIRKIKMPAIVIGAVILVLILGGVGYKMGYRFGKGLTIGKVGYLEMTLPLNQTSIFIDQSRKIVTEKDDETVKIPFSPHKHSVIVSHAGYFPWKKDFEVSSSETAKLSPIFVTSNTTGQIITNKDPEYYKIRNEVIRDALPTKKSKRFSNDKSVSIWIEDGGIMAKVASTTLNIVQIDSAIRNIDFYKDRNDSIMFSTSNSVYVIEIDKTGNQNFMPIYKGQSPSFIKVDNNSIYVLDGLNLMQIII